MGRRDTHGEGPLCGFPKRAGQVDECGSVEKHDLKSLSLSAALLQIVSRPFHDPDFLLTHRHLRPHSPDIFFWQSLTLVSCQARQD